MLMSLTMPLVVQDSLADRDTEVRISGVPSSRDAGQTVEWLHMPQRFRYRDSWSSLRHFQHRLTSQEDARSTQQTRSTRGAIRVSIREHQELASFAVRWDIKPQQYYQHQQSQQYYQHQQPQQCMPQQQCQYQQQRFRQQQEQRGLPAPPQRHLLPASPAQFQGQRGRGGQQPRAQQIQQDYQDQMDGQGQQMYVGLAAVEAEPIQVQYTDQYGERYADQYADQYGEQYAEQFPLYTDDRPKLEGRMYVAGAEEAVQDTRVITGTLLIQSTTAIALFDSSSTHTFLARTLVDRIGMEVEDLEYDLRVTTPAGAVFTTSVGVRGVAVVIQRRTLLTDLIVLPMREFDAIFGMDWLARHRALIDCQKKKSATKA